MHPLRLETGSKTGKGYVGNLLVIQVGTFVIVDDQSKSAVLILQGDVGGKEIRGSDLGKFMHLMLPLIFEYHPGQSPQPFE
jgi:hypothetical protein